MFKEVIFPPLERPIVSVVSKEHSEFITDGIYCFIENDWITLDRCMICSKKTRHFSEILEDLIGCM